VLVSDCTYGGTVVPVTGRYPACDVIGFRMAYGTHVIHVIFAMLPSTIDHQIVASIYSLLCAHTHVHCRCIQRKRAVFYHVHNYSFHNATEAARRRTSTTTTRLLVGHGASDAAHAIGRVGVGAIVVLSHDTI
jgi:hypothetical protein